MEIYLHKFGTTLTSRQAGKEALSAFSPNLNNIDPQEPIEIDFSGISTFSPSWGDEFLTPLHKQFKDRLTLVNALSNPSVRATLELLESLEGKNFKATS